MTDIEHPAGSEPDNQSTPESIMERLGVDPTRYKLDEQGLLEAASLLAKEAERFGYDPGLNNEELASTATAMIGDYHDHTKDMAGRDQRGELPHDYEALRSAKLGLISSVAHVLASRIGLPETLNDRAIARLMAETGVPFRTLHDGYYGPLQPEIPVEAPVQPPKPTAAYLGIGAPQSTPYGPVVAAGLEGNYYVVRTLRGLARVHGPPRQ